MGCAGSVPAAERNVRSAHRRSKGHPCKKRQDEATTTTTDHVADGVTPRGTRYTRNSLDGLCGATPEAQSLEASYANFARSGTMPTALTPPLIGFSSSGAISACPTLVHQFCLAPGQVPLVLDGSLKRTESSPSVDLLSPLHSPALIRSFGLRWNHDNVATETDQLGNNLGERPEDLTWEALSDGSSSAGSAASESSPFVTDVKHAVRAAMCRVKARRHEFTFVEGDMATTLVRTRSTLSPDINKELEIQKAKCCDSTLASRVAAWEFHVYSLSQAREPLPPG